MIILCRVANFGFQFQCPHVFMYDVFYFIYSGLSLRGSYHFSLRCNLLYLMNGDELGEE